MTLKKQIRNPKFETNGNQMKSNRENPKLSSEIPVWSFLIFEHLNLFRISVRGAAFVLRIFDGRSVLTASFKQAMRQLD